MAIRVPCLLANLVPAEISKRQFFKSNGEGNANEFFNKMLPNMLAYRAYKKGMLRDYLDKNIKASIAEGMQEKILDFLAESFDYLYFDESEYECDDVINIRFDVNKEEFYAQLFVRLDNMGIKRSAYLRNLIHEYFNLSEYQKERICFNEEYNALSQAISQMLVVQLGGAKDRILPIALEYSVKSEHWYLLYFEEDHYNNLRSIPLFRIKKVLLRCKAKTAPERTALEKTYALIDSGDYDKTEIFFLGSTENA